MEKGIKWLCTICGAEGIYCTGSTVPCPRDCSDCSGKNCINYWPMDNCNPEDEYYVEGTKMPEVKK